MKAFEAERVLRRMTALPDQIIDPQELRWRAFGTANTLVVRVCAGVGGCGVHSRLGVGWGGVLPLRFGCATNRLRLLA